MRTDWIEVGLGTICDFIGGGTPSKSNPKYWVGEIPWASIKDLKGSFLIRTEDSISEEGLKNSASNLALANEIILATRINPGRPIISKIRVAINQDLKIVKPVLEFSPRFLFYLFKEIEPNVLKLSSGTTVLGINLANLKSIAVPLPPLPEQRAIVARIEELFSELDHAVSSLQAAQAKLDIYRQAVLKKAFEGKADDKELTKFLGSEVKPEFGKERLKDGWRWESIGEVVSEINNGYTPKREFLNSIDSEIPFIKVYNLNFDGSFNFEKNPTFVPKVIHNSSLKRSICLPGDVLINIVGPPLGKVSIVPADFSEWNINQAIVRFRPNERVSSKFLSYYLQNPEVIKWLESTSNTTAGQRNIRVSVCREIPLALPKSIEEQTQIVQEIESRLSVADKLAETIQTSLQKAEALRQSILKKAFEGRLLSEAEVEACRKEADWEPTERLLERIRQDKGRNSKRGKGK